ncbi:phosphoribosyltransferase [Cellulomonas hominis]|uniref:phosphoribosyltransferase n=1 Tax=Cellulomonas hominis TaxID=156981 RepID=UPI001C1211D9|nr:phosphoribosyltransferase family protein [Cellulomonas hominis]MBU5421531.1 phosphoribosyltransferase [Cellulomonas hominis]
MPGREPFSDRAQAGAALADRLAARAEDPAAVVLALPRGGVPVAVPVAARLHAPLDVLVVRKLGVPVQPELAMGALAGIAGDVVTVLHERVLRAARIPQSVLESVRAAELAELHRRERAYRRDLPALEVAGRTAVVVDDGAATGSTVRAAIAALRRRGVARVVVALPVCPPDTAAALAREADELVCLRVPARFEAVGLEYASFAPPSDAEVRSLLLSSRAP